MNSLGLILVLLSVACTANAGRRYIAIPVDGIDVIELNPITPPAQRLPRQTEAYIPIAVPAVQHEEVENQRPERSAAHILDYVDFGAHSGTNGAFSWYADYPAHH